MTAGIAFWLPSHVDAATAGAGVLGVGDRVYQRPAAACSRATRRTCCRRGSRQGGPAGSCSASRIYLTSCASPRAPVAAVEHRVVCGYGARSVCSVLRTGLSGVLGREGAGAALGHRQRCVQSSSHSLLLATHVARSDGPPCWARTHKDPRGVERSRSRLCVSCQPARCGARAGQPWGLTRCVQARGVGCVGRRRSLVAGALRGVACCGECSRTAG